MAHDEVKAREVCALLTLILRAMVSDRDAVMVEPLRSTGATLILQARVAARDKGKVVGTGGRMARSLRIILLGIAKEIGENYQLDLAD